MNYYRRYVGDFQADTMALSMMEQGAYDRLLDHYYATEKPIPLNSDRAAIICRAITLEERAAVQMVLETYFHRTDDGWKHRRVEKELALSKVRSGAGKNGAESRWDGKPDGKPHSKVDGKQDGKCHADGHAESMQNLCPPTTNHQEKTKPLRVADGDTAFGRFWEAWPSGDRKVAKKQCREVWQRRHLDQTVDQIVAHVRAMKETEQWRKGYEPAPLTYLRQQRWEDGDAGARVDVGVREGEYL